VNNFVSRRRVLIISCVAIGCAVCLGLVGYGIRYEWIASQRYSSDELRKIDLWAARIVAGIESYRQEVGRYPISIEQLQNSRHRVDTEPGIIADGWEYCGETGEARWELRIYRLTAERWRTDSTVYPRHYLSD